MTDQREAGWYWVKEFAGQEFGWEPATYDDGLWYLAGWLEPSARPPAVIGPRIEPPKGDEG